MRYGLAASALRETIEQRRQAVAQERGPEHDEERGDGRDAPPSVESMPPQPLALDRHALVDARGTARSPVRRAFDEMRRRPGAIRRRRAPSFDRAQDGGLERRVAFLEVQRHLRVGDAAAQRPDEGEVDQAGEDEQGDDAERDDGGGG